MRRHILGIISAVMLVAGVALIVQHGLEHNINAAICIRAGLVLGAIWLALPQISQMLTLFPPWLIGCCVVGLGALVWRPKVAIFVVGPLLAALAIIQFFGWLIKPPPRKKRKAKMAGESKEAKS